MFSPEIVRMIVFYLKNDKQTLHSCLLVSRDWCRNTVDLLWSQPFHFLYTCNNNNSGKKGGRKRKKSNCCRSSVIRQAQSTNLLLTYLSTNEEFVKEGIIEKKNENTIFNYFEFLNILNFCELYYAIKASNFSNSESNIQSKIFLCFFTYSPNLKSLLFDTKFTLHKTNNSNPCSSIVNYNSYINGYEILSNLLINESKTPEIKRFLVNLTELVITEGREKIALLNSLSNICHNIQKLIIRIKYKNPTTCRRSAIPFEESRKLVLLIRSQHNLVYLELFDIRVCMSNFLESLKETQCDSLKTLIFNNVEIRSNFLCYLKYLQKLEELRFNKCTFGGYNDSEVKNNLEGLWFPNLKYLKVDLLQKNGSKDLYSILLGCSPLID